MGSKKVHFSTYVFSPKFNKWSNLIPASRSHTKVIFVEIFGSIVYSLRTRSSRISFLRGASKFAKHQKKLAKGTFGAAVNFFVGLALRNSRSINHIFHHLLVGWMFCHPLPGSHSCSNLLFWFYSSVCLHFWPHFPSLESFRSQLTKIIGKVRFEMHSWSGMASAAPILQIGTYTA